MAVSQTKTKYCAAIPGALKQDSKGVKILTKLHGALQYKFSSIPATMA
jgi:hypothetical protein